MRKIFSILLTIAVFSLVTISPVIGYAATDSTTQTDEKVQQSLKTRVEKYQKNHPQNMTATQLLRVKNFCKLAQTKTKTHTENAVSKGEKRLKVYNNMNDNLKALIVRMKDKKLNDKDVDTTKLDALMKQLGESIAKFKADLATYQVSLNDVSTMDCQSDPASYKSALEETRANHKLVIADSEAIFKLIKTDIKAELKVIKDALKIEEDKEEVTQ